MIHILVVDDLKALLEMVKYILETNPDFSVDTASSVEEALLLFEKSSYDIIISDYYMPEMTGLDLLKIVRKSDPEIPFIIQTGQGDEQVATEALENGADYFLEKGNEGPLQYLSFTQIINILVQKKRTNEKLIECHNKFTSLFDSISDGLILFDDNGFVQEVNSAFLEMTGYSDEEVKNLKYWEVIPEEWDKSDIVSMKNQVFSDGYSEEYKLEYQNRDGTSFLVSIRAHLVDKENISAGIWVIIKYI